MAWVITRKGPRGAGFMGVYRDFEGAQRSAGVFATRREALREAERQENLMAEGRWFDAARGAVTFRKYVEEEWLPSKHVEATTRSAYRSNLDKHFLPAFGHRQMSRITPSTVQDWVTGAAASGLSPRSIAKYHTMLRSIFNRAVRDSIVPRNPCAHTELPRVISGTRRTLEPAEFEALLGAFPHEHSLLIETAIETGMRWGELIALKPRHIDFLRQKLSVEETIVEVSKKHSPTSERFLTKAYPKSGHSRRLGVSRTWLDAAARHIRDRGLGQEDLMFTTSIGTPISRNTFRTRVWLPAVAACGIGFHVRVHDLRHAHASWLVNGGSDLKSVMDRMGHAQIQTTQRYLHALDDADQKNLGVLEQMRARGRGASSAAAV